MIKTKNTYLALVAVLLSPMVTNADEVTLSFEVVDLRENGGLAGAPDDPVVGTIVYQAADLLSTVKSLVSVNLTIDGFSYQLSDMAFESPTSIGAEYDLFYGALNDGTASSGTNDFFLTINRVTNEPVVFLYTTESTFEGWRSNTFSQYSRTVTASTGEIVVTYEGEVSVTIGAGFGYAVGDPISGSFVFDTDNLDDVYGDGSFFQSGGPVSSSQSSLVDIYPENLDSVLVWNFEQGGYDNLVIGDATQQSGNPTGFTQWHSITMYDDSEIFDLSNLPAGGLVFSASDVAFMQGNIAHRTIDSGGYVEDQLAEFEISSIQIEVAGAQDPRAMLDELENSINNAGFVRSWNSPLHARVDLAKWALDHPDGPFTAAACWQLRRMDTVLGLYQRFLRWPIFRGWWGSAPRDLTAGDLDGLLQQSGEIQEALGCS